MSAAAATSPRRGISTTGSINCPACGEPLTTDSNWCPACNFTGAQTVDLFPESPPPLLPILDAAGILNEREIWKIEAARDSLRRRFPQFQWRICTVVLPAEANLSLFGFWLLNACPLHGKESTEDRAATVLLLINAGSGQVAAIPGYAVESVLSDDDWKAILATMAVPWRAGHPVESVIRFFKNTRIHLERVWKSCGTRQFDRKSS